MCIHNKHNINSSMESGHGHLRRSVVKNGWNQVNTAMLNK